MTTPRSTADEFSDAVVAHLASLDAKVDAALGRVCRLAAGARWLLFETSRPALPRRSR